MIYRFVLIQSGDIYECVSQKELRKTSLISLAITYKDTSLAFKASDFLVITDL